MKLRSNVAAFLLLSVFLFTDSFSQTGTPPKPRTSAQVPFDAAAQQTNKISASSQAIEREIAEALTLVQDKHVDGKKVDYNTLFKSINDNMLHTLDPHSNYFDAKEAEAFRTEQASQYFGIGALLGNLSDTEGKVIATYIRATFQGAPANRAGLRYGDKIVAVNGLSMLGKNVTEVRTNLIGPRGTPVKITVERPATGKREEVEIVRDAVSQPSIAEAYMIRPGIGYIAMTGGFHFTTYPEFLTAMRELKAQGMTQLVLDLRNNPGGLVNQALLIANTFLARGQTILTQKGRIDEASDSYRADNPAPDQTPLVVMVNGGSASASEILSGALQDHDRALIVGENTFGKGLVQKPIGLEYGSMLLLTIAKYETPSGRLIQRDYSDGNLYNYLYGGTLRDEDADNAKPKGAESKTDSGRPVYSGGGINPDVVVKPDTITIERARGQQKLIDPIFAFALEVAYGRAGSGFDALKVDRPIAFNYDLKTQDFVVSDILFQAFKKFAVEKYKLSAAQIDREHDFVNRALRSELVTAAYGSTTSLQVINEYDNQLKRAIELLPQAKQLAIEGAKANARKTQSELNR